MFLRHAIFIYKVDSFGLHKFKHVPIPALYKNKPINVTIRYSTLYQYYSLLFLCPKSYKNALSTFLKKNQYFSTGFNFAEKEGG